VPVVERIDVLPWVRQFAGPFLGNPLRPRDTPAVFIRQQNDQPHRARWKVRWNARLKAMLFIDIAEQFDRFHRIRSSSLLADLIIANPGWKTMLRRGLLQARATLA
jgi:hypothetical protein